MKLAKYHLSSGTEGVGQIDEDRLIPLNFSGGQYQTLTDILEADNPLEVAEFLTDSPDTAIPLSEVMLRAPIDRQEVWGVDGTYKSKRVNNTESSDAPDRFHSQVYASPRPELFFKATPHRVVGPGESLRIRKDSEWNVPEPELALVLNSRSKVVGFTIGNDMSSRAMEAENPLYLAQAKIYDQCCSLGPCIQLLATMHASKELGIAMVIRRAGEVVFQDQTSVSKMARTLDSLIGWLIRDNSFPNGVFLLTGTGVSPSSDFTLLPDDVVEISIDGIGTLRNPVVQG